MVFYRNFLGIRRQTVTIHILRPCYSNRIFARSYSRQINNSVFIIIVFCVGFIRPLYFHLEVYKRNQFSRFPVDKLDFQVFFYRRHIQSDLDIRVVILLIIFLGLIDIGYIRSFLLRLMRIRHSQKYTVIRHINL